MDDSRWHILRVKPGCETAVAAECGVPAYVPHQRVTAFNRKLRKVMCYVKVLIPGIIFIKLRAPSDFQLFAPSRVFGFLRNGDRTPAILTGKAFEALVIVEREALNSPKPVVEAQSRRVKVGETVGVQMAQFADAARALIEEIKGNKVFVRMLQSNLRVETTFGKLVA